MSLIPVAEALARVLDGVEPLATEHVPLAAARGRILAEDLLARRTQPPFDASAMDGYALRAADAVEGALLSVVGESAAGRPFDGQLQPGEAARIFTGAPLPQGADAVLIQEQAEREADRLRATAAVRAGQNIRREGLDFRVGTPALRAPRRLGPRDLALAAACNHPSLPVRRRPRVAILATGDEIVMPGEPIGPSQIVASNNFALAALAEAQGASLVDLGIARDDMGSLEAAIRRARQEEADILVTIGGASVGDHDLVQAALTREGLALGFWRIAMRPGKPMMHGRLGPMHVLGLPGNPVSAVVCGVLFLVPLIRALSGLAEVQPPRRAARLAVAWPGNDVREDYLRARFEIDGEGRIVATPFAMQDSSMVSVLQAADGLVLRAPHAPPAEPGEPCKVIAFADLEG